MSLLWQYLLKDQADLILSPDFAWDMRGLMKNKSGHVVSYKSERGRFLECQSNLSRVSVSDIFR